MKILKRILGVILSFSFIPLICVMFEPTFIKGLITGFILNGAIICIISFVGLILYLFGYFDKEK